MYHFVLVVVAAALMTSEAEGGGGEGGGDGMVEYTVYENSGRNHFMGYLVKDSGMAEKYSQQQLNVGCWGAHVWLFCVVVLCGYFV